MDLKEKIYNLQLEKQIDKSLYRLNLYYFYDNEPTLLDEDEDSILGLMNDTNPVVWVYTKMKAIDYDKLKPKADQEASNGFDWRNANTAGEHPNWFKGLRYRYLCTLVLCYDKMKL